jgi:peptidoglycan/xylan/chitin deacetylase (PgdA/CDA1 family)
MAVRAGWKRRLFVGALLVVFAIALSPASAAASPVLKPQMSLTFDDAPRNTLPLLGVLAEKDVPATFFMVGKFAQQYPALASAVAMSGATIGNHSYDHTDLSKASPETVRTNLTSAQNAILAASGVLPRWFRPPYLAENPAFASVLPELGLTMSIPAIDSMDWDGTSSAEIADIVLTNASPGAVVMMHDHAASSSNGTNTIDALPVVIDGLRARGYVLVPLDEIGSSSIDGTVTDKDGHHVAGVTVTAFDATGEAAGTAQTGNDGRYHLGRLPDGDFRLRFSKTGYPDRYYSSAATLEEATSIATSRDYVTADVDIVLDGGEVGDTTPPQTSLSPALPTTWVRSNVSFTLAATDDGGPSGIVTLYSLTPPGGTKSYTAPVTVTAQGVTSLSYWSVDAAGNAETSHTGTIRIDSSAPVTTSNAKSRYARTATIRLTATDRYSGVAATRFSLDGAAYKTGTSVTAGTGSHTLRFYSTDVAGNTESVRTVRFTVRR